MATEVNEIICLVALGYRNAYRILEMKPAWGRPPMNMEDSVPKRRHKIQTLGNHPKEMKQHSEQAEVRNREL